MSVTSCALLRAGGAIALACTVLAGHAFAQAPSPAITPAVTGRAEAAPDSPRASLARFLELTGKGRFAEAAQYLDLPPGDARGSERARRLKAVLERHVRLDLEAVSASPEGDGEDGLEARTDEIAAVPGPDGRPQPVRLRRDANSGRWLFSRQTVDRVDAWYDRLEHRWLLEHMPAPLLRPGPRGLMWWQWLALPVLVFAGWAAGSLLSRLTRAVFVRLARRTDAVWDDALVRRLAGPLTLAWTLGVTYLLLPWLGLDRPAQDFVDRLLRAGLLATFFWSMARSVDVAAHVLTRSPWAHAYPASRSLVPLGARVTKVAVLAMAVVALISEMGYPVASLVAGLGIGGLAVALAAQKTVENLFGAFSIGADQPFREGDFVRVDDLLGTVEDIGLRSTRIRTLDRTLVSIPNGRLAEMRLESLSARDRMRLACTIGLVYGTTVAQMREVLAGLEGVLRAHPRIWPDTVVVRFREFAASSLDIEVMAWFQTPDWSEFQLIRQEVLLQFMEVVEKAGTGFAFPTRTVHLVNEPGAGEGRT